MYIFRNSEYRINETNHFVKGDAYVENCCDRARETVN